jgi:ATP adenylyltransferase
LSCTYCDVTPEEAWIITDGAVAVPHPQPLTACHVVVAPRRHVLGFYELDVGEQRIIWNLVTEIQKRISAALKVEGFDVGFADGNAENPVHAHIHVVPRSPGESLSLPQGVEWVNPNQ